jgi:outer membrane beta-barrel protein
MKSHLAIAWLLVFPVAAAAQQAPGIDLSSPPPADEKKPSPDDEEAPPIDLSKPGQAAGHEGARSGDDRSVVPFSEKDVALGDKVKAVQRKGFLKRGRFEVAPMFALTMNDAFFQKYGPALRIAYNVQDSFAIALRAAYFGGPMWGGGPNLYDAYRTDNVREAKIAFQSQLLSSQVHSQLMLDGMWSPVYGKLAFLQHDIVHFDLFLAAGFGVVRSATSDAPLNQGSHLAADLGGGIRFYPKEWLAFEMGVMATLYPDQPVPSVPGTLQSVFVANVGFSFFFPFRFEYVEP